MSDALINPVVAIAGLTAGFIFLRYGKPAHPFVALLALLAGIMGTFRPELLAALTDTASAVAKGAALKGAPPRVSTNLLNWAMMGYFGIYLLAWALWGLAGYGAGRALSHR